MKADFCAQCGSDKSDIGKDHLCPVCRRVTRETRRQVLDEVEREANREHGEEFPGEPMPPWFVEIIARLRREG